MITEENFLNLVKITNNINENNMPPSEYTWFFRGAKLAWLFYNIVEKSHNKNDKIKIEYLVNKYNAVNCLIADYAKVNEPNLKKIMQLKKILHSRSGKKSLGSQTLPEYNFKLYKIFRYETEPFF